MYYTSTGGAEAELFIARENGTFTSFSGGGSPASGFEILEAVPEPSTYAMLGLGVAALVAYRRKCRKSA